MEVWKTIEGFEDYQVSNLGNVKSFKKKNGLILIGGLDNCGYKIVCLQGVKQKTLKIHQLVAIHFLNHTPCGHALVVNHKDFNKQNNNMDNLEIVTHRENSNLKHIKSSSKYTGVSWSKQSNKWVSHIQINGKLKYLGLFTSEYDAHLAYENELKLLNQQ